jgi:glycosyltransferase involved in cell wall biosynthesis
MRTPIDRDRLVVSVVIPCFNEEHTVAELVRRVLAQDHRKQVILVDDASTDATGAILEKLAREHDEVRVFTLPANRGKGAALRRGFEEVRGDVVIVQDADLEYDPKDYTELLEPIFSGSADAVFGSRFMGGRPHRVLYFWHMAGNKFLTLLSNMFTNLNLTDVETGCKAFRAEVVQQLDLREDRFGFEPEITAKLARARCRIYEVGVSYRGRTYKEGKKVDWKDGFRAIYAIVRYNLFG